MIMRSHYRLMIAAVLCSMSVWGQPYAWEGRVDSLFAAWDRPDQPGVAIGMVRSGELVFARGYGMANLENGIPFRPETVSDIGSVSKQFTDFAILLLERQGKLSLDDDIHRFFPELPDFGRPITIRHLIHHTSGLREIYAALAIAGWQDGDGIRQEDALRLARHSRALNFPPGERHSYCNTGYMLLADIISQVSGQPFETWMRDNLFQPLGMQDTYIMDEQGELFPLCADSYAPLEGGRFRKIYDNSSVQGAGGIYTTIADLAKWLNNYRHPMIGDRAMVEQMQQRGILNNGDTLRYAFGLVVDRYRGLRRLSHTGSSAGYRAAMVYFPDQDLGILLKSNRADCRQMALADQIADFILGAQMSTEEQKQPEKAEERKETISPGVLPQDITGHYVCPELETAYYLEVIGDQLQGFHRRHGKFLLEAVGKDLFRGPGFFREVQVIRNDQAQITGLRVTSGGAMNVWFEKQ